METPRNLVKPLQVSKFCVLLSLGLCSNHGSKEWILRRGLRRGASMTRWRQQWKPLRIPLVTKRSGSRSIAQKLYLGPRLSKKILLTKNPSGVQNCHKSQRQTTSQNEIQRLLKHKESKGSKHGGNSHPTKKNIVASAGSLMRFEQIRLKREEQLAKAI